MTAMHHDQLMDINSPFDELLVTDWATDPSPNICNYVSVKITLQKQEIKGKIQSN